MKVKSEKTERVIIEMDGPEARSIRDWLTAQADAQPPHSPVGRLRVKLTNAMAE